MAVQITVAGNRPRDNIFGRHVFFADIKLDDEYPQGGYEIAPSNFGITSYHYVSIEPVGGYVFEFDKANNKLIAYQGEYSAGADGPLAEVVDKTDLSSVTVQVMVVGI